MTGLLSFLFLDYDLQRDWPPIPNLIILQIHKMCLTAHFDKSVPPIWIPIHNGIGPAFCIHNPRQDPNGIDDLATHLY